jgi:outer membrane protein
VRTPRNVVLLVMFARASGLAQQPLTSGVVQQPSLTINQAVLQALDNYPAVRSSLEQVSVAAAEISLARTAYLPRADFLGEVNRATHNNVFGMVLPQSVIPNISGPVLGTNSLSSVWGASVGSLVTWEPFDFGLRKANVEVAGSVREQLAAEVNVTRLQVGTAAADGFLTVLAAQETVTAAKAAVDRATVLNQAVEALVRNQLRPGADASRTRAELALAQTQLIQAEQAVDVGRAALAQLLGISPEAIKVEPGPLLELPADELPGPSETKKHPSAIAQNLAIGEVRARQKALDRSYYPRFYLQAATYGRGTGIQPNGDTGGAASGLGPNIGNWALGMTVTFPVFDIASIRARKEIEFHSERSEAAKYAQVIQDLNGQLSKAQATLTGSQRVAQNTPIELEAARVSEQQANARYRSGLSTVVDVAEAERILTQAQIDDALAKLGVWRALLGVAAARGDIQPFLLKAR